MEDDESWLYGDDQPAEASADVDIKKETDVSIFNALYLKEREKCAKKFSMDIIVYSSKF